MVTPTLPDKLQMNPKSIRLFFLLMRLLLLLGFLSVVIAFGVGDTDDRDAIDVDCVVDSGAFLVKVL